MPDNQGAEVQITKILLYPMINLHGCCFEEKDNYQILSQGRGSLSGDHPNALQMTAPSIHPRGSGYVIFFFHSAFSTLLCLLKDVLSSPRGICGEVIGQVIPGDFGLAATKTWEGLESLGFRGFFFRRNSLNLSLNDFTIPPYKIKVIHH